FRSGQAAPISLMLSQELTIEPGQVLPLPAADGSAAGTIATVPETYAAGTLVPSGTTFSTSVAVGAPLTLSPSLFASGFSAYDISSDLSVVVMPGTVLHVTAPVYR